MLHKILHAAAVIVLLALIACTFLYVVLWHHNEIYTDAVSLFVCSEQFIADHFYDRTLAMDRVSHYKAGLEGIRRTLRRQGFLFSPTDVPENAEPVLLQRLFASELERAAVMSDNMPWPLAYAASQAMCESMGDSHTSIGQPQPMIAPPISFYRTSEDFCHLIIRSFESEALHKLPSIIFSLESSGFRGVILDLRHSIGGDVNTMCAAASCFLQYKTPLMITANSYTASVFFSTNTRQTKIPLVVLIDDESYSAAEMLAEILQHTGRARLVGTKTPGHFGVASIYPIDDSRGVVISVTNHMYLTVSGRSLEGVGVTPNVIVADEPTQTGGTQFDAACVELERLIAQQKK